ncbi:MAG: WD40 repeat domain-containing protein [Methylobacterium sp.]|nr:WD40 repeat domain-containing protein [Methylobacterium sp.]
MIQPASSLTDRVQSLAFDAHILAAGFVGGEIVIVTIEGTIQIGREAPALRPHADAILAAKIAGDRLVTGGDDGRVFECRPGEAPKLLGEGTGWVDALALGPDGATAWSIGRQAFTRDGKGQVKSLTLASSARGLAFFPKGYRLAVSQNGFVPLWFPNMAAEPEKLEWKGSHLECEVSPDGRFVLTSMQENQLHGWRLADKGHMRMSGYPAKVRDMSWSHDGLWLATSGAEAAIIWPFAKDGPMGKPPRECGARPARVSKVAFHPKALVLAIGYADGWVLLVRLTDASELLVRAGGDGAAITALAWDQNGRRLIFGAESGAAGLLDLPV